jgi:hypothetical protein
MNVKKYQAGGIGPKKKAAAKPLAKTRAQEIEESKMVGARRAEDLKIAEKIKKDVRSEVGPGSGRPSSNKGNVTLASAKSQKITEDGVNYGRFKAGKFSRAELVDQFSGKKQQRIYRKGQTLGYAPEREVSSGAGFTAKASMPSRGVQKSGAPTAAPKTTKPALSAEMQRRVAAGEEKSRAIGQKNFEFTMEDARRRGIRLNNGGMIPKKKK